jgi:alkylation response protein AidB-like acyl-CoA dehydrogenase
MRRTIDFLLHHWLQTHQLTERSRYQEHSVDTFSDVLDSCERLARDVFAPHNRTVDAFEPRMTDDGRVWLPEAAYLTAQAYRDTGLIAATQDTAIGGLQLPHVVEAAANAFFAKAGIGLGGGAMLTTGSANLLLAHGSPVQKTVFAQTLLSGRWSGTMCLSEAQAGSSLSDITTRATPDDDGAVDPLGPRYRIRGSKNWVSNGEHDLTENIVHLVLAKIPDPEGRLTPGVRGISLFIVPKRLVDAQSRLTGAHNDVALAGLNHKCGYRGMPNAVLNFGEGKYPVGDAAGAIGYLVGEPGHGLAYMFHLMNEARIAVGLGAAAIAYAGFEASLEYARTRRQGRPVGATGKDASLPPVAIIEHADVRRMLLAQKAFAEGSLALVLYAARLVDDTRTAPPSTAAEAQQLLELLTPVVKSWPSQWGLEANSLAIQIHGGYGYTRDFPVEQYWRDQRLNMIHEGAHGIHGIDLLGRKVRLAEGAGLRLLATRVQATAEDARSIGDLSSHAEALTTALTFVAAATRTAWVTAEPEAALANATPYLEAVGHLTVAWLWLDIAVAAARLPTGADAAAHRRGLVQACHYFFAYELPKIEAWLAVVASRDDTCRRMADDWY